MKDVIKKGELKPLKPEQYRILIQLVNGDFSRPVKERTRSEKSAIVLFWRNKRFLSVRKVGQKDVLYFRKKRVLTTINLRQKVVEQCELSKGIGARAIAYSLKRIYSGISERDVLKVIKTDKSHGQIRAKFSNKAPMKPIIAQAVFERVQIDLISMNNDIIEKEGKTYRYILTAVDVFSRFVFLRALERKTTKCVVNALTDIFETNGYPNIIQMDNGNEFKGEVQGLFAKKEVKIIKGRPYHPQSQGKVERTNKIVKQKINYDIMRKGKIGYNWAESLQGVANAINHQSKEVLNYETPFAVYFGRHLNYTADYLRKKALEASQRCAFRETAKASRLRGCTIYRKNDKVLVKYPPHKRRIPTRYCVLKGVVLKGDKTFSKYLVTFTTQEGEHMKRWINVEFLTSRTTAQEDIKRKRSMQFFKETQKKIRHRQSYYFPINQEDDFDVSSEETDDDVMHDTDDTRDAFNDDHLTETRNGDEHFENDRRMLIALNPTRYGNCQFDAVANQITKIGLHRSGNALRMAAVTHIRANADLYSDFVPENQSIDEYVLRMSRNATYGDHLTLQALSIEFNCQFLVVSSAGYQHNTLISPCVYSHELPLLTLGYYPENRGEHYVSIEVQPRHLDYLINRIINPQEIRVNENHPYNSDADTECYSNDERILSDGDGERISTEEEDMCDGESIPRDQEDVNYEGILEDREDNAGRILSENEELDDDVQNIPTLPCLVLEIIIRNCIRLHPEMLYTLQHVSIFFRNVISRIGYPTVYIDPNMMPIGPDMVSVRRLNRAFGRNSGLMDSVRDILQGFGGRWINAWLELSAIEHGWFEVREVYWRIR